MSDRRVALQGKSRIAALAALLLGSVGAITGAGAATVPVDAAFDADPTTFHALDHTVLQGVVDINTSRKIAMDDGGSSNVGYNASSFTVIFSGLISGNGVPTISGTTGKIVFAADETYTSETAINASGVLQIGNGGTTGSLASIAIANSGTLIFNRSDTSTYAGSIGGTGALVQAGTGTTILTGNGSLAAGITISAGRLQFGNGGTTGIVLGNVVDNGALVFNRAGGVVYGNQVTGTGLLELDGHTTLTLTNFNTYTGGTVVSAGSELVIQGSIVGDVLDNGSFDLEQPNSSSFAGAISGTGRLVLAPGVADLTAVLTGASTYTGGTIIIRDNLQLGDGGTTGSIVGDVAITNGSLGFDRSNTYVFAGNVTGPGTLIQLGTGTTVLTGASSVADVQISAGTLQLGNGGTTGSLTVSGAIVDNGTLAVNHSDTVALANALSGTGGLSQIGTGTLLINTQNTATGRTLVSSGTLIVGDAAHPGARIDSSIGGVAVQGSGTLKGYGTIVGAVGNTGTVAPGGSIGTLTVGSFTQGAAGTLQMEVAGATSDLLQVTGAASLGGTLQVVVLAPVANAASFNIINAASVTGTFATVSVTGVPTGQAFGLHYGATSVSLVVVPGTTGQIYSEFARNAFDGLLTLHDTVFAHADSQYCRAPGDGAIAGGEPECPELSVWWQLEAGAGSVDGDGALSAFNSRAARATAGIDYYVGDDVALGLVASYARSQLGLQGGGDRVTADEFAVGLRAGTHLLDGALDAAFTYGVNNGRAHRTISAGIARSEPRNDVFGVALQYSHPLLFDGLSAFARLGFAQTNQDAFSESGAVPLDLAITARDFSSWYGQAGLRYSQSYALGGGSQLIPDIAIGVRTLGGPSQYGLVTNLADTTGAAFVTTGIPRDRTSMTADVGLTLEGRHGTTVYVRASGSGTGSEREGMISIGGQFAL
jgi:autotransporter-associated beta strand protein